MEIQLSPPKNKYPGRIIAIILCAGKGTRIKDVFPSIPKCLIKIQQLDNITILNYLISALLDIKIDLIEIIIGHLGSQIEEYIRLTKVKNKKRYRKVGIINSGEEYQKGSFFSFLSLSKNLSKYYSRDLFLVFPGDTIFPKEILENVLYLIYENGDSFRNFPSIFFQEKKKEANSKGLISIVETYSKDKKFFLKKIVQIDCNIQNLGQTKQVVPILSFPYKFIINIIDKAEKMKVNTIKDMLNLLVESKGQEIIVNKLSSESQFYDIDSESDLISFEKKVDNSCSD